MSNLNGGLIKNSYVIGKLIYYPGSSRISDSVGKTIASLTPKESELLRFLIEREGTVATRENILINVWGRNDYFLGRSMDVFISRLRKDLKADPNIEIKTIHTEGYIFTVKN